MSGHVHAHVWAWEADRELCCVCGTERDSAETVHDILDRVGTLESRLRDKTAECERLRVCGTCQHCRRGGWCEEMPSYGTPGNIYIRSLFDRCYFTASRWTIAANLAAHEPAPEVKG
jgi:nicotinamide mononucleotide adenylyltransferase